MHAQGQGATPTAAAPITAFGHRRGTGSAHDRRASSPSTRAAPVAHTNPAAGGHLSANERAQSKRERKPRVDKSSAQPGQSKRTAGFEAQRDRDLSKKHCLKDVELQEGHCREGRGEGGRAHGAEEGERPEARGSPEAGLGGEKDHRHLGRFGLRL